MPLNINAKFSNETQLKSCLDLLYQRSKENVSFTGLLEAIANEVTIITAIHNIKSNKGSKTSGVDKVKVDRYLQMPKEELISLIQSNLRFYRPKPARRIYIEKDNGKQRPLGIPTILDRIIQECVRIIIEPIVEAKFYPHSYGFRPYRAQRHAVRGIINVVNGSSRGKLQPIYVLEGDIKGCFDNINHRILMKKLWRMGIRDKRVLKIIYEMLKAGYIEYDIFVNENKGTGQGAIISPLLSNVYLNDFDWYVGRKYYNPVPKLKTRASDVRKLRYSGVYPKYNFRFADDWVILTTHKQEAYRLKKVLTKYFKHRLKLELSDEKTKITDMTKEGIRFLGFCIKVEKNKRNLQKDTLVAKPFPDMEKLQGKIRNLCKHIRHLKKLSTDRDRIAHIHYINSVIMGIAEYIRTGVSSEAYRKIDFIVNDCCYLTWKCMYPHSYTSMIIPLEKLSNFPQRHEGYISKVFAIKHEGKWIGVTKAFITHIRYEQKPFNQKMTPYTTEGRRIYANYRSSKKPLPRDRPSVNTLQDQQKSVYRKGLYNFEFFMNREYAFNRDKWKCRCCGRSLIDYANRRCHHVNKTLPLHQINKVPNLAWVCDPCHRMIHSSSTLEGVEAKIKNKIQKFRDKLESVSS